MQFKAQHAKDYLHRTIEIDATDLYPKFLVRVSSGGHILDAGCGSGRDSKVFSRLGFQVSSFDTSADAAAQASHYLGRTVATRNIFDVDELAVYDGIWANASLLHVPQNDMPDALTHLWLALKPEGVLYCNFLFGSSMREVDGQLYTDANIPRFDNWRRALSGISSKEIWLTEHLYQGVKQKWFNALLVKGSN